MTKWILSFVVCVTLISFLQAQDTVQHNFDMKPQKTNCAEIQLEGLNVEQQIITVENGIYRYTQDFKLNRIKGFQAAWYYSCDNKTGYVIAKVDNKKSLYSAVTKEDWEKFVASGDFLQFIEKHFKNAN